MRCGGAFVIVTRGDPECPERVAVRSCAACAVASSYQAEVCVLSEVLSWLDAHLFEWDRAIVVSDSQAGVGAW